MSFAHRSPETGPQGEPGPQGIQGIQGIQGEQGPPGEDAPDNFLGLVDTPDSYVGQGGQAVAVKATEDGLEFVAPGGGVTDHALLSHLSYADADHTGFCSLATPQTITAQKLIDSATALRFGHAAGPTLAGEAADERLMLAGRLRLDHANPNAVTSLEIVPTGTISGSVVGVRVAPSAASLASSAIFVAVEGYAVMSVPSAATPTTLRGLNFYGAVAGGGNGAALAELSCIRTRALTLSYTGTVTAMKGLFIDWLYTLAGAPVITTMHGIHITGLAGSGAAPTTVYGLQIGDIALGTNRYLIEAGPATPSLRLLANSPPNAGSATEGDSQLFLAWMENGVVTLRRTRWRQQSSLLATDKVLIAA